MEKKLSNLLNGLYKNGRYGEIRTLDPCHPMTVRYQAALHTDVVCNSTYILLKINK